MMKENGRSGNTKQMKLKKRATTTTTNLKKKKKHSLIGGNDGYWI